MGSAPKIQVRKSGAAPLPPLRLWSALLPLTRHYYEGTIYDDSIYRSKSALARGSRGRENYSEHDPYSWPGNFDPSRILEGWSLAGKPVAPAATPVGRNPEREPPAKQAPQVEGATGSSRLRSGEPSSCRDEYRYRAICSLRAGPNVHPRGQEKETILPLPLRAHVDRC